MAPAAPLQAAQNANQLITLDLMVFVIFVISRGLLNQELAMAQVAALVVPLTAALAHRLLVAPNAILSIIKLREELVPRVQDQTNLKAELLMELDHASPVELPVVLAQGHPLVVHVTVAFSALQIARRVPRKRHVQDVTPIIIYFLKQNAVFAQEMVCSK